MSWRRVHRAVGDGSCIVSHFQRSLNMTFAEKSCGIFSLHLPQCTYDTSLRLFIYQQPKLSKVESVFSLTFPEPLFFVKYGNKGERSFNLYHTAVTTVPPNGKRKEVRHWVLTVRKHDGNKKKEKLHFQRDDDHSEDYDDDDKWAAEAQT